MPGGHFLGRRFAPRLCGASPVMNHVCRQRWVVVCLLFVLMPGLNVFGQFLNADIYEADPVTNEMKQQILEVVDPAIQKLNSAEPKAVSDARGTLTQPMRNKTSAAFRNAYSDIVSSRLKDAAGHKTTLVRLNAMIIAADLVDKNSKLLIDAALKDENPAVQRKAMEAIRRRVQYWLSQPGGDPAIQANITAAMKQIGAFLDQKTPPHAITVAPALLTFLDINSTASLAALGEHLNKRVAVHAATPNQGYYAEQLVIDRVARLLFSTSNPSLATAISKASWRFASLLTQQIKAGVIKDSHLKDATAMVGQSLLSLGQITAVMDKQSPPSHVEFKSWVQTGEWDKISALLKGEWVPILKAAPFSLSDADLELK